MAVAMAIFSVYLMYKSAELPIGWIPDSGPGGGAYPFWLSVGMLICCIAIIVRAFLRMSPPSRSTEVYMDRHSFMLFLIGAGSLTVTIGLIQIISAYCARDSDTDRFLFFLRDIAADYLAEGIRRAAILSAVRHLFVVDVWRIRAARTPGSVRMGAVLVS